MSSKKQNRNIFFVIFSVCAILKIRTCRHDCGVTPVGTTHRRVPKLRHEVECCVLNLVGELLIFFLYVFSNISIFYISYIREALWSSPVLCSNRRSLHSNYIM